MKVAPFPPCYVAPEKRARISNPVKDRVLESCSNVYFTIVRTISNKMPNNNKLCSYLPNCEVIYLIVSHESLTIQSCCHIKSHVTGEPSIVPLEYSITPMQYWFALIFNYSRVTLLTHISQFSLFSILKKYARTGKFPRVVKMDNKW